MKIIAKMSTPKTEKWNKIKSAYPGAQIVECERQSRLAKMLGVPTVALFAIVDGNGDILASAGQTEKQTIAQAIEQMIAGLFAKTIKTEHEENMTVWDMIG